MTIKTVKATAVVATSLALLGREVVLPATIWRPFGLADFRGKFGDALSIRLPAYTRARTNQLRSGDTRTRDSLAERKVDVSLNTRIYKDIEITDEEFTLDIIDFTT